MIIQFIIPKQSYTYWEMLSEEIKRIKTLFKMLFKNAEFAEMILSPEPSQTQTTICFVIE